MCVIGKNQSSSKNISSELLLSVSYSDWLNIDQRSNNQVANPLEARSKKVTPKWLSLPRGVKVINCSIINSLLRG